MFWLGNLKRRHHSEDLGIDGRIILECILGKVGRCGMNVSGSGQELVAGSCEYDNERLGSIKGGIFLDYLSDN
jgi:hypothetical protein